MNKKVIELRNSKINKLEGSFLLLGEKKIEMDSYIACGEVFINGNHNNRSGLHWNCSKDEQAIYANKLRVCVDTEILEQPLPKSIEIMPLNAEDINNQPVTIGQNGEESEFYSLLLFGKVVGEEKEILISYNCSLNKKIIFANTLKTMIDHHLIKELTGRELEELINDLISKRLDEELEY